MTRIGKKEQLLPIGIDLGSESVKVVQLRIENGSTQLIAAESAPVPDAKVSIPEKLAEFTKALKLILKKGHFHGKQAILSIPAEWTFVHHLRIPKAVGNESLDSAIKIELRDKLPYRLNDAILRYVVAGDVYDDGDPQQEVIAISAKRNVLEAYAKAAKRAGLEVTGINIESCAIVECFAHLFRRQADLSRTILFVDLGTKTTQVVFSRGNKLVFARNLMMAGESMTQIASEALGISPAETDAVRMDILANRESEITPDRLYDAYSGSVGVLSDELMQCMRYYESVFPGFAVERAIFVGGQAYDRRLCQLVAQRLNLPAQIGDPLVKIQRLDNALGTNNPMPNWAVAIGLSLGAEAA